MWSMRRREGNRGAPQRGGDARAATRPCARGPRAPDPHGLQGRTRALQGGDASHPCLRLYFEEGYETFNIIKATVCEGIAMANKTRII